ncbi:hypothetical protein BV509_04795 [Rhodovulum sulfidophilum]|uniref:hypothetical protein n=1 Tax=Rhodovulum visakhapatnamense TaxID=364297 RepID=UPI0009524473|nr:hypothetical protein [Rhodovulum visakhapatnamense]OLS43717.1 hypothetical protein BV509_04795 [Rhodovulum sulfidophilum]
MSRPFTTLRSVLLVAALALVAACGAKDDLDEPPVPLGDFRLGYAIVVAKNAKDIPPSRQATAEEWETVLKEELERRFGRYDGDKIYHLGIAVDGYALAVPGVPVVLAPKSMLVLSANLWDDAAGKKLNTESEQLSVGEGLNGATLIGTGLTRTKDEQMRALARNAAKRIERWLVEHREDWLNYDPDAAVTDVALAGVAAGSTADPLAAAAPASAGEIVTRPLDTAAGPLSSGPAAAPSPAN